MRISLATVLILSTAYCFGAEKSPSEKSILKAIAGLEADRDKLDDAVEELKISVAIRELRELLPATDSEDEESTTDKVTIALKKKLNGKVVWKEKTGELTIGYDFVSKSHVNDFEVGSKRIITQRRVLALEAGTDCFQLSSRSLFVPQLLVRPLNLVPLVAPLFAEIVNRIPYEPFCDFHVAQE